MELRAWRELPAESRVRIESAMGSPSPGLYRLLGKYLERADKPYRAEGVRFLMENMVHLEPEKEPEQPVARRGRPRKAA